ncbi:MAG: DNA translocase FtsK [Bacteroidales bacterium]|nr:DNA translocase FtsK [Bacteroidales bacterium]
MSKKEGNNKTNTNKKRPAKKARKTIADERLKVLIAFLFMGFAFLLLISQLSYLLTWKSDQSFEWNPAWTDAQVAAENWAGKTGAFLANLTINKWFGVASFAFPPIIFLYGLLIIRIKPLPFTKTLITTILSIIVLSVWLAFLSSENTVLGSGPGGRHGYYMSIFLISLIGKIGTFILLVIASGGIAFFINKKIYIILKKFILGTMNLGNSVSKFKQENDLLNSDSELNEENDDLVFETEFPQQERTGDTEQFTVKDLAGEKSQAESADEEVSLTIEDQITEDDGEFKDNLPLEDYDPTLELASFQLPPIDLLEKHDSGNSSVTNEELISNKNKIVDTLGHYKIQIDKIKATIGPTVTLYEIVPAPGVRISKIKNLEDDIALNLSALGIRIIAPIPGRGTIGIEVPNQTPEIVSMRSLITSKRFQESDYDLAVALGKTISNETYVFDLTKMPHLLVAGATGQGKSVGLNAIIASILYRKHPSQVKFVLVDPKKVELTLYSKIENHYLAKIPDTEEAIITDTQKVINTLNSLTIEMDQRYDLLKKAQVRNIKEYNRKFIKRKLNPENGHRYMPYIVVVIDEFADLIMTAGREVETPLARLAQLARAIGIHLVIATQRPTTNIITGVIKANFPARIAFRVTSMIDSRTILDTPGANQLVGRGDLLFAPGSDLIRLQCAFIDIPELERITNYIGEQKAYPNPYYLPEYVDESSSEGLLEVDLTKRDSLFNDAARVIVAHQQGSTSLIQRKFSIGYNRAGRIIDQLEAAGIVGPFEGSKARQVLFPDEYSLEQYLNSLDS